MRRTIADQKCHGNSQFQFNVGKVANTGYAIGYIKICSSVLTLLDRPGLG